jgi:hypothetical protein
MRKKNICFEKTALATLTATLTAQVKQLSTAQGPELATKTLFCYSLLLIRYSLPLIVSNYHGFESKRQWLVLYI